LFYLLNLTDYLQKPIFVAFDEQQAGMKKW
jgi:hypothetical protein